jgi:hypothetical protein
VQPLAVKKYYGDGNGDSNRRTEENLDVGLTHMEFESKVKEEDDDVAAAAEIKTILVNPNFLKNIYYYRRHREDGAGSC